MTHSDITNLCRGVRSAVASHRLLDAFDKLDEALGRTPSPKVASRLRDLRNTHRLLVHYMLEGFNDPSRALLLDSMEDELMRLADRLDMCAFSGIAREEDIMALLGEYEAERAKLELADMAGAADAAMHRIPEEKLTVLFNLLLKAYELSPELSERLRRAIGDSDEALAAQIVSALMLASLRIYDRTRIALLARASAEAPLAIRSRIIPALAIIMLRHSRRIDLDAKAQDILRDWLEQGSNIADLRRVVILMIRTADTDRVNRQLDKEVIPGIMKLRPEIMKRLRDITDTSAGEANPEWEELLDKSGLTDRMRELSEMQTEGADLMMTAFSRLKQFSFFRETANWFLPFSADNSVALDVMAQTRLPMLEMLEKANLLSDSDKYSFVLGVGQMPASQREMMAGQFSAEMTRAMKEAIPDLPQGDDKLLDAGALSFLRDVYRFFRLCHLHNSYSDPFAHPVSFALLPSSLPAVADAESLRLAAEFYFRHGYYPEAEALFNLLGEEGEADAYIEQKLGYCRQQAEDIQGAIEHYRKAELLGDESSWLLRRLAALLHNSGDYLGAISYYERAQQLKPDSVSLARNYGHSLLEAGRTQEAVKQYYRAEYKGGGKPDVWRALAWCELLLGNYDKSRAFYEQLLTSEPIANDYLNAGHLALIRHELREALAMYRQAVKAYSGGAVQFMKEAEADRDILLLAGVPDKTMRVIADAACSSENF